MSGERIGDFAIAFDGEIQQMVVFHNSDRLCERGGIGYTDRLFGHDFLGGQGV